MNKLAVALPNFSEGEAQCKCGCGKDTSPTLMVKVQALVFRLERKTGRRIRCMVNSGARCKIHNTKVYHGVYTPSYHMGRDKVDNGVGMPGAAIDVLMQYEREGKWENLDKEFVANEAIAMNIFGGVGYKIYGASEQFVHLDEGPTRVF